MYFSVDYNQCLVPMVPVYVSDVCGIPHNVTPVSSDSGLQVFDTMPGTENELLRMEVEELRVRNGRLMSEVEELRSKLSEKLVSVDCIEGSNLIKSTGWFCNVADFWTNNLSGMRQGLPHALPFPMIPALMARIDGALRVGREGCDFGLLFNNYFKEAALNEALMDYIYKTDLQRFLTDFYSMKCMSIEDPIARNEMVLVLVGMHLHAESNCNINSGDMLNALERRCNHDVSVCTDSLFVNEIIPDDTIDCSNDHIYGKNQITTADLVMLHGLSHLDERLSGSDVAKYHVGKACRISECSIMETFVNGKSKYFSPIKCSGEYMICERLPNEVNGRVSVILRSCGMVPLTLVRVIDKPGANDMYLVTSRIGPAVTAMMQNYSLVSAEIYFNDDGLCVKVSGYLNIIIDIKCCDGAFKVTNNSNRQHKHIRNAVASAQRNGNRNSYRHNGWRN